MAMKTTKNDRDEVDDRDKPDSGIIFDFLACGEKMVVGIWDGKTWYLQDIDKLVLKTKDFRFRHDLQDS